MGKVARFSKKVAKLATLLHGGLCFNSVPWLAVWRVGDVKILPQSVFCFVLGWMDGRIFDAHHPEFRLNACLTSRWAKRGLP